MAVVRTPSIRVGFRVADSVLERDVVSRTLDERDYNVLLNEGGGPVMVYMPDGRPLACYLPGALSDVMDEVGAYGILHPLYSSMTNNRGMASGSKRIERGGGGGTRSDAMNVSSSILGTFEPSGVYRYCRMTEWTGSNLPEWTTLAPLFRVIARHFEERVTERYNVQMNMARKTDAAWVVPGTPFTTITVNNSYPTGVHKDQGDLEDGFSTIACIRRGDYEGGALVFPQYRVAVDMQDGDLLLMDAHQWHGNTRMTCACGERIVNRFCAYCGAERISIVSYFRTRMAECGSPGEELERATVNTEKRSQPRSGLAETPKPDPGTEPIPLSEMVQLEEPAAAVILPDSERLPEPEPESGAPAPARRQRKPREASIATVPPAAIAAEAAPETKPKRAARKRTAKIEASVEVAVDPATGEPLV
jgi:hypothetical protein